MRRVKRNKRFLAACLLFSSCWLAADAGAAEDYSFSIEEFEKKPLSWGGYLELKGEQLSFTDQGAFRLLTDPELSRSGLERLTATVQLDGNYRQDLVNFIWLLRGSARQDQRDKEQAFEVFSAYVSINPTPNLTFELGKKTFKWGKGYAWNPVAFIDRPKDPDNPEEALEGYLGVGVDLIKSFAGPLRTLALTSVLLPVWNDVNEDFGARSHVNLATKLYLLYRNTDIDLMVLTGASRSTRYGIDVSKNLKSNLEIHAELAHTPEQTIKKLDGSGRLVSREQAVTSYLVGLRYLTVNDITIILEYYHNGAGYTQAEMKQFYQLINAAHSDYLDSGGDRLLRQATVISRAGYASPQAGRNYLYLRMTQKEPFDLLYFTPGVTAILNLDDESYSLSPEAVYSGFTNWELRLRYSRLSGGQFTDYGEKMNESRLEVRLRYFF